VTLAGCALLGDRAVAGGQRAVAVAAGAGAPPFALWRGAVAIGLLVVVGLLPAWRLVGRRPLALFLAPCLGGAIAGVSAAVTVGVASEPLRWFVAFAAAANAAAAASLAAPGERKAEAFPGPGASGRHLGRLALDAALLLLGVALAGSALAGRGVAAGATEHWLSLATLLVHGHRALQPALASPAAAQRLLASPLGAGVGAVTWLVTRSRSPLVATGAVGGVVLAALGVGGAAVAEAVQAAWATGRGRQLLGALLGVAWVLAGAALLGAELIDGSLGALWTVPAASAVLLGLVVPWQGWSVRAALLLGVVGALAAPMGSVAMVGLVLALVLRRRVLGRRGLLAGVVGTAGLLAGVAAAVAWPVVAALKGAAVVRIGPAPGSVPARLDDAWHEVVAAGLWPAGLGLAVALVGLLVVGRQRGAGGGGSAGVVAVGLLVLAAALVAEGWDAPVLQPLVATAPARAGTFCGLVGLALAGRWTASGLAATRRSGPGSAVEWPETVVDPGDPGGVDPAGGSSLDGDGPGGLHRAP
jgi:hypothetical protein